MTGKQLFLLDGAGAVLSALMLGAVLLPWQSFFGMPVNALRLLTVIAIAFACYSWSCYFLVKADWRVYLRVIMLANVLYALLSAGMVYGHFGELTVAGLAYFLLELIVLAAVIYLEYRGVHQMSTPANRVL